MHHLDQIREQQLKLQIEEQLALKNAYQSNDVDSIMKAMKYTAAREGSQGAGKSILIDPFNRNVNEGFYNKNTNLSFNMLRAMSLTPIPRAIIGTRKAQISEFTTPQTDKYSTGFIIRKKRKHYEVDEGAKLSKKEEQEIDILTEFILNCGDKENKFHADDFEKFVGLFVEDSLSLDQGCFEIVRGRKSTMDNIVEFYAVDGATIRIADSIGDKFNTQRENKKINGFYPSYVQTIDGIINGEFYPWDLCLGIRNPQTNIKSSGYGRAELEDLTNTVTDLLNAAMYNSQYFRIGSNPKGILRVKNMNTTRIEEFRQNWMADMAGVKNAHKLPIIDADSLDFINTQGTSKDMEYHKYLEFLIKIGCAHFKISPEEIGFTLEGTGTGGLGGGDNKTELEYSRNKGLVPLLRYLQAKINKYIIGPKTDDKYELVFVGYDQKTEQEELEDDVKKVTNGGIAMQDFFKKHSGREFNKEKDIILNPVYLQYKQMETMSEGMQSNEFVDGEYGDDNDDDNPFIQKAIRFIDEELNQPT